MDRDELIQHRTKCVNNIAQHEHEIDALNQKQMKANTIKDVLSEYYTMQNNIAQQISALKSEQKNSFAEIVHLSSKGCNHATTCTILLRSLFDNDSW